MAFRKTVRGSNFNVMNSGNFGELKCVPVNDGSKKNSTKLKLISIDEISSSSLPLITLDEVRKSGKVIDGNVSFAPSDPSNFNEIQDIVENYVDSIPHVSKPVEPVEPVSSVES